MNIKDIIRQKKANLGLAMSYEELEKQVKELEYQLDYFKTPKQYPCKVGDSIHLHDIEGVYSVIRVNETGFVITCKKWQKLKKYPRYFDWESYKCKSNSYGNLF